MWPDRGFFLVVFVAIFVRTDKNSPFFGEPSRANGGGMPPGKDRFQKTHHFVLQSNSLLPIPALIWRGSESPYVAPQYATQSSLGPVSQASISIKLGDLLTGVILCHEAGCESNIESVFAIILGFLRLHSIKITFST